MNLTPKGNGFEGQFRCGDAGRPRVTIMTTDETIAQERAVRMQAAVSLLVRSNRHAESVVMLKQLAAAKNQRDFAAIEKAARDMAGKPLEPNGPVTYRHVAELWLSGALRMQDKDAVAAKGVLSTQNTRGLMNIILPILGDLPIGSITVDDCDKVKRAIAQMDIGLAQRKKYCRTTRQVFKLAVEPLRLIKQPPISEDWIPKGAEPRRAFQMLYPHEDATLLACTDVAIETRFYVGLLLRTAMRPGEGAKLQWRDWSATIGKLNLDDTKTNCPRAFFVSDDVAAALEAMRPEGAEPDDYVFPAIRRGLSQLVANILHPALKTAGLDKARAELFVNNGARRHITAHDCRGAYVAMKTALGATEREIMAVSGHMTSKEITTYQREATELQKLVKLGRLAWYGPLDALLGLRSGEPEGAVDVAQALARAVQITEQNGPGRSPARTSQGTFQQSETLVSREKPPSNCRNPGAVPPGSGGVAQDDGGRARLAAALADATAAKQWKLAERITTQLEALEASQGVG